MELQFEPHAPFTFDPVTDTVVDSLGRAIRLSRTEFRLLHLLQSHAGQVLTCQDILQAVWGYVEDDYTRNLVRVSIYRVRRKIEPDVRYPRHIVTVRGQGYTFRH